MFKSWPAAGSANLAAFVNAASSYAGPVKRWDGAARTCQAWDSLQKDPELWLRNGNCLVHLYSKGSSDRGPSFRLHFKQLLAEKCFPLIQRFLVTEGPPPRTIRQLEIWGTDPTRTVELYIPPPVGTTERQAHAYHMATRNFFAWVLRRSLVGEHLGQALVGLMCSMSEFRADVKDNVGDMMEYMDEEGYLTLVNQPTHALAVLYLAEYSKMKSLYIRAYAHCAGMGDEVCTSSEFQYISMASKKLIRHETIELETRNEAATVMLRTLLDDELSESQLGIPPGARAHLERFRSFLMSYYTTSLGYYPPTSFEPKLLLSMRLDFEGLYSLLVDRTYSGCEGLPTVASGGICVAQQVQMFDDHYGFTALEQPLPLLPHFQPRSTSRRIPWRQGHHRLRSDERVIAHASLIKASNWKGRVFQNGLVKAYRGFEEETVLSSHKADKQERVSLVDARKVRWILVYAVYQVLRSVTEIPPEVVDFEDAPYPVAVSTKNLPPWNESASKAQMLRHQPSLALSTSPSILWADSAGATDSSGKIEIKPDIDYFALTHGEAPSPTSKVSLTQSPSSTTPSLLRSSSVSRVFTRSGTLRRSIRRFRPKTSAAHVSEPASSPKPVFHEILVRGYGNGLNEVDVQQAEEHRPKLVHTNPAIITLNQRQNSTASNDSASSANSSSVQSMGSDNTLESTIETPTTTITPLSTYSLSDEPISKDEISPVSPRRDVVSMLIGPSRSTATAPKRPKSTIFTGGFEDFVHMHSAPEPQEKQGRRHSLGRVSAPISPTRHSVQPQLMDDDWAALQAFMDDGETSATRNNRSWDAWEQYAELGGLTDMR